VKAAIIGMGVVGRAQERLFGPHAAVTYDVADGAPYPGHLIAGCDFAVITVGTPAREDGSADLGSLYAAMGQLPPIPVLLRSTVPPGTTDRLGYDFPQHLIAHAPEFLYEGGTGPWSQSADVPWMLLGGVREVRGFFRPLLERVYPGVIWECSATVAEVAKYTANLYWATRVTFVNEMAAVAKAAGADWDDVRDAWLQDQRVHFAHTAMTGFPPGFGGRCWPKDLSALIAAAADAGYKAEFLEAVQDANARFRSQ
jgi:nucleotide sugar dehydrogenase